MVVPQPALLDLDARGASPSESILNLPLDADDLFTEMAGYADVHTDHRNALAQLHVWAIVSVLQAVGTQSEHGRAAVEAAGAEVWMEVEIGSDPWGALPAAGSAPSNDSESESTVEAEEEPPADNNDGKEGEGEGSVVEEGFWKVEEQALKDLVENGTSLLRCCCGTEERIIHNLIPLITALILYV